jgi:hypothetical protein
MAVVGPDAAYGEDVQSDIARVEARIEELRDSIERCRKLSFGAKVTIAAGAAWIVLVLLQIMPFVPFAFIAAMAAVIGGIVLLGSNDSTWRQTEDALRKSEAVRTELIEAMQMRLVEERPRLLH